MQNKSTYLTRNTRLIKQKKVIRLQRFLASSGTLGIMVDIKGNNPGMVKKGLCDMYRVNDFVLYHVG